MLRHLKALESCRLNTARAHSMASLLACASALAAHEGLTWVQSSVRTVVGVIVSNWRVEGQGFRHTVTVPPGASAEVHLPTRSLDSITQGGKPLAHSNGARLLRFEKNRAVLALECGTYNFLVLSQSAA